MAGKSSSVKLLCSNSSETYVPLLNSLRSSPSTPLTWIPCPETVIANIYHVSIIKEIGGFQNDGVGQKRKEWDAQWKKNVSFSVAPWTSQSILARIFALVGHLVLSETSSVSIRMFSGRYPSSTPAKVNLKNGSGLRMSMMPHQTKTVLSGGHHWYIHITLPLLRTVLCK